MSGKCTACCYGRPGIVLQGMNEKPLFPNSRTTDGILTNSATKECCGVHPFKRGPFKGADAGSVGHGGDAGQRQRVLFLTPVSKRLPRLQQSAHSALLLASESNRRLKITPAS